MKREVCIYAGGYYASRQPTVIHTLLGSCVAVCLYDPATRIGGMNHFLLPGRADLKHFDCAARYGINAMELLINKIMALGGYRHELTAKVFGGAHVLPSISQENGMGRRNIEFVEDFLQMESIRIINRDVGGQRSRKIRFHTDTGDVFLKRGKSVYCPDLSYVEGKTLDSIRKTSKYPGKIIWF
jgi:chemotaxis protein CheD